MKKIISFILCLVMLMSVPVFVNAETDTVTNDPMIIAYFNASQIITSYEFTNIDVLNYHPAHVSANAMSYTSGPIVTHDQSSKLESWKTKAYAQNPDIKFVFTVANGNINDFESWFSSPDRAKKLANEMLSIVKEYGYDGLDIDYEFPGSGNNPKNNYVRFMKYMREGFDALSEETGKEYILSMAVPATSWAFSLFKINELAEYVSYFNIMSYDLYVGAATPFTHHHTPPYDNSAIAGGSVYGDIQLYLENGIPADKIVAGCGMYSRRWTGVENVNNGLFQPGTLDDSNIHYTELKARYINRNGYTRYWDDTSKAPYLYNPDTKTFLSYDDEESVKYKCEIVAAEGIRGIMVFDYCTTDGIGLFDNMQTWLDEYAHTHEYTSEVTLAPTCADDGVMTYTCECGDSYEEAIPATGEHSYGEWTVITEPTYDTVGTERHGCTVCGDTEDREIPVLEYVNPFTDVIETAWYGDAVEYCVKKGYISGMTPTAFEPNANLTRAQFLTILAKYDGVDLSAYEGKDSGFDDVKPAHWWNEAICWAVENEYTAGVSTDRFGPNNYITREQLARFFYVYAEKNGLDVSVRADLSKYEDAEKIGSWARENVEWAVEVGIISGISETKLSPRGNATRAQAARMFMLFDENL